MKLVCTNVTGVEHELEYGKFYEHLREDGIFVWVIEGGTRPLRHLRSRFKNPADCIKCVKECKGGNITIGKIYEVIEIGRDLQMVRVSNDRARKSLYDWKYFEDLIKN